MRDNKQSAETKKNNFFIELFLSGSSFFVLGMPQGSLAKLHALVLTHS